jgi:hypothetical protein
MCLDKINPAGKLMAKAIIQEPTSGAIFTLPNRGTVSCAKKSLHLKSVIYGKSSKKKVPQRRGQA